MGAYDTGGMAQTVAVSGNYAYVADGTAGLQVIDVSNPANPKRTGAYDTGGYALGVAVSGNFAYVADGDAGLQVIDISNPANPQRVGGFVQPELHPGSQYQAMLRCRRVWPYRLCSGRRRWFAGD